MTDRMNELERRMPDRGAGPGGIGTAVSQATVVEQTRAAAEVAAAVQAARMCPRDEDRAYDRMRKACSRYDLANQAFYTYPAGGGRDDGQGKDVHGPTVALARELGSIWGNCEIGTTELARDDALHRSEIRASARDWETNAYFFRSVIVPHVRYTAKDPAKAAIAKMRDIDQNNNSVAGRAEREVTFKMLRAAFVAEAKRICYETLERGRPAPDGQVVPIADRIREAVEAFGRARPPITRVMLEKKIGRPVAAWSEADVAALDVLFNTLRRKEITREEAFPGEGGVSGDEIRAQATQAAPTPAPRAAKTPPPAPEAETDAWQEPDPATEQAVLIEEPPAADAAWPDVVPPGTRRPA